MSSSDSDESPRRSKKSSKNTKTLSKSKNQRKIDDQATIARHNKRYESESEDSEEESEEEVEEESGSEESGSEEYSDEESYSNSNVTSNQMIEKTLDIEAMAIHESDKKMLKDGKVREILTFEYTGSLASLQAGESGKSGKIEVWLDGTSSDKRTLKETRKQSHELSEIESISVIGYQNTLAESFPIDINGVKESRVSQHRGAHGKCDLLATSETERDFSKKPVLVVCPTKMQTGKFVSENPDVTFSKIKEGVHDVPNSEFSILTQGSVLHRYLDATNQLHQVSETPSKEGMLVIQNTLKHSAMKELETQIDQKNICSVSDISITISAPYKGKWYEPNKIESSLPKTHKEQLGPRMSEILNTTGRILVQLEVVHKPVPQASGSN